MQDNWHGAGRWTRERAARGVRAIGRRANRGASRFGFSCLSRRSRGWVHCARQFEQVSDQLPRIKTVARVEADVRSVDRAFRDGEWCVVTPGPAYTVSLDAARKLPAILAQDEDLRSTFLH